MPLNYRMGDGDLAPAPAGLGPVKALGDALILAATISAWHFNFDFVVAKVRDEGRAVDVEMSGIGGGCLIELFTLLKTALGAGFSAEPGEYGCLCIRVVSAPGPVALGALNELAAGIVQQLGPLSIDVVASSDGLVWIVEPLDGRRVLIHEQAGIGTEYAEHAGTQGAELPITLWRLSDKIRQAKRVDLGQVGPDFKSEAPAV